MCSLSSSTRSSTRGTSKASNNCGSKASDNCGGKASGSEDCNINTIVACEKGTSAIAALERALQSVGVSADGVIGLFELAATIVEVAGVVGSARL